MPDLTGLSLPDATALVAASGLKTYSISSVPSPDAPANNAPTNSSSAIVVGQTPAAGSRVTPGTLVSFQIARS
jgi:beta-lactam-binding protein with PASTA domain